MATGGQHSAHVLAVMMEMCSLAGLPGQDDRHKSRKLVAQPSILLQSFLEKK
jgi:hypothetical protein